MRKKSILWVVLLVVVGFSLIMFFRNGAMFDVNFFKSKAGGDNTQFAQCLNKCREDNRKCERSAKKGDNAGGDVYKCLIRYSLCIDNCYSKYPPVLQ